MLDLLRFLSSDPFTSCGLSKWARCGSVLFEETQTTSLWLSEPRMLYTAQYEVNYSTISLVLVFSMTEKLFVI